MRAVLPFSLLSSAPDRTEAFARSLAPRLGAGDVLALSGSIGAGKSLFARALIAARLARHGMQEDIPSPTFTLVQTYQAGALEIWHSDLYRLSDPDDVFELGLEQAFDTALCLVEWPDRLGPALPAEALRIEFAQGTRDTDRHLSFASDRPALWADRLAGLADEAVSGTGDAPENPARNTARRHA